MDDEPNEILSQESDRREAIHSVASFAIVLGLLILGVVAIIVFVKTKPEADRKDKVELVPTVRVKPLVKGDHQVQIHTQGVVRSVREVSLAAELGGRVMSIAPEFVDGGSVKAGQMLLEIDTADYQAAFARTESGLADAEVALQQEKALAEQATLDWKTLGRGEPNDLVLRKPQIAAAEARIESAKAEVLLARRNLERTTIRAPFDARVRHANAEVGAVVAPGTPVAELYSASELEVRLPFTLQDYGFLELDQKVPVKFDFNATIGGIAKVWPAVMLRLEGEVERTTLSGYGIAKVMPDESGHLPPVGLFVDAVVPGMVLENVVRLPRTAVRGRNDVWVVEGGHLLKRKVEILRSEREHLVVRGDFGEDDQLVFTRLAAPLVGMKVEIEPLEVSADE